MEQFSPSCPEKAPDPEGPSLGSTAAIARRSTDYVSAAREGHSWSRELHIRSSGSACLIDRCIMKLGHRVVRSRHQEDYGEARCSAVEVCRAQYRVSPTSALKATLICAPFNRGTRVPGPPTDAANSRSLETLPLRNRAIELSFVITYASPEPESTFQTSTGGDG